MKIWLPALILLAGGLLFSSLRREESAAAAPPWFRGAWLARHGEDGYLTPRGRAQMGHLHDLGFRWVAYAPEPSMANVHQPDIKDVGDMEEHRRIVRALHDAGLKVLLFPRIESPTFFRAHDPRWRGDIEMQSPGDWVRFHDQLEAMLLRHARLAEEESVEMFCLGLEYRHSTTNFPDAWSRIISRVRQVYSGPLTYSANWYREYRGITFWKELDYIGIGAYFPLADKPRASRAAMRQRLSGIMNELRGLSQRYERPVIFTEVGFPAFDQAGWKPWEWTTHDGKVVDQHHQADCYRAFFDTVTDLPWFHGYFVWRYHTDTRYIKPWEYCPQGREAEEVIREQQARPLPVVRAKPWGI